MATTAADTAPAAAPEEETAANKRSPSDFLKSVLGRPVRVKLNSGMEYRGVLACLDGYMNIAMEQTEEYVDGKLQGKYGDCFLRGNNGACGVFPIHIHAKEVILKTEHTSRFGRLA